MTTKEQIASWRQQAERIKRLAEEFGNPELRRQLLEVANNYRIMADDAERSIAFNGTK